MNTSRTLLCTALLVFGGLLSLGRAEQCGPEGCAKPAEMGMPRQQEGTPKQPPVVSSRYQTLPSSLQGPQTPVGKTQAGVAVAPPPLPAVTRTENTAQRQESRKNAIGDGATRQIFTEFAEEVPPEEVQTSYGEPQRITPEGTSQVPLSSSDINRIICPVAIKDVIYSKEKGLTVRLADNNAFVKFLVMKKDGRDLYATAPSELYLVCGDTVYTMIAVPKRIPAQTVQLSAGKADSIKKNLALFNEIPLEKKIIGIIKRIYTDNIPDSFTIRNVGKAYTIFADLSLVLHRIVTVDGEGLRVKEFRARIIDASKNGSVYLKEKDFLNSELVQRPLAVSIDILNLKKGETSRVFVVEKGEGGRM